MYEERNKEDISYTKEELIIMYEKHIEIIDNIVENNDRQIKIMREEYKNDFTYYDLMKVNSVFLSQWGLCLDFVKHLKAMK